MITKIEELAFVVNDLDRKIEDIQYKLSHDSLKKTSGERMVLEEREIALKKQIQNHIKIFRCTISSNYITLKLFSSRLDILEKKHLLQPQILDAALYCLAILKEKHSRLKKDSVYFLNSNQNQEADLCNYEMQMIEIQSQNILKEFHKNRNENSQITISEESKLQFTSILLYYKWDFETVKIKLDKRKEHIERQLEELSLKLKSIIIKFDYRKANKIKQEIKLLEEEHVEINIKILHNIDYIL